MLNCFSIEPYGVSLLMSDERDDGLAGNRFRELQIMDGGLFARLQARNDKRSLKVTKLLMASDM